MKKSQMGSPGPHRLTVENTLNKSPGSVGADNSLTKSTGVATPHVSGDAFDP